jgi:hypothetical protein
MSELLRVLDGCGGMSVTLHRRANRDNEWSSEEVRRLKELAATGVAPESIASALRRTESAIRNKAGMHGISLRSRR